MPEETHRLRTEVEKLRREIERLTTALATTDEPPPSLLQGIADRDKRLRQAELDLAQTTATADSIDGVLVTLELDARRRLRDMQTELAAAPELAREALVALTDGEKLRFSSADGKYQVAGSIGVSGLLKPDTAVSYCSASPGRFDTVGNVREALQAARLAFVA